MTIKDVSYFVRQSRPTSNESGRSLVEMLGTIGIITMITVGAISGANTGMTMWKASQTHEQIMEIIQGVTDMYSWKRNGWPDGELTDLCETGGFSSCRDGKITFSLGGGVTVTGRKGPDDKGTILEIKVTEVKYGAFQHLLGKEDGVLITSIECSDCNNTTFRGSRTLTFVHDASAVDLTEETD